MVQRFFVQFFDNINSIPIINIISNTSSHLKVCGILFTTILLFSSLFASVPQKMNYQAVVRNDNDELVRNQRISMQISILHYTSNGIAVYVETQTPQTNVNGLVSIEIGGGNIVSGDFSTINWADGPYFIKTEIDIAGGILYNIVSVQQLLSVPYALYAHQSGGITDGTAPGEMLYWDGTDWVTISPGQDGAILTLIDGVPTWEWTPSPPIDVYNSTTGKYWMDRNLGASRVATSSTDTNSYGDLYQWGRYTDGHEKHTSGTTSTLSSSDSPGHGNFILAATFAYDWRNPQNDNLWQGVSGVNNPCPSGYRIPTEAEWDAEYLSWESYNSNGAFTSLLKLPIAGDRSYFDGAFYSVGSDGFYWSSTVHGSYAQGLSFSISVNINSYNRAYGFSVRCIKD